MKPAGHFIVVLSTLWLVGCTAVGTQLANLPTHFDGITVKRDVVFDPAHDQGMDIYLPAGGSRPRDVVIFFYGGRWTSGSKDDYAFIGSTFAKAGYIVAIPDYRKYPDVRFPTFAEDTARAVSWVADNIATYGGNPQRIFLSGHSSGAHLAALVATDPQYLKAEGKDRSIIKAFAGLAGPYAFIPEEEDLKDMFGPPENYPLMQATTFVDGRQPPMLLLWGGKDTAVGQFNLDKMKAAIDKNGGCVKTRIYPDVNHVWIVGALSWLGSSKAPVFDDMTTFFQDTARQACD